MNPEIIKLPEEITKLENYSSFEDLYDTFKDGMLQNLLEQKVQAIILAMSSIDPNIDFEKNKHLFFVEISEGNETVIYNRENGVSQKIVTFSRPVFCTGVTGSEVNISAEINIETYN